MDTSTEFPILKFSPLQSFVDSSFWFKLADDKLEIDRLSEAPKNVSGVYTNRNAKSCIIELDYSGYFNKTPTVSKNCYGARGTLYTKNTIEEFKAYNKVAIMAAEGKKLLQDFYNGRIFEDPTLLARFFLVTYIDLKSHTFYYWFGFPCPLTPTLHTTMTPRKLKNLEIADKLLPQLILPKNKEKQFFILKCEDTIEVLNLKEGLKQQNFVDEEYKKYYFCFADPSEYEHPSWLMRVFAAIVYYQCPNLIGKCIKFMGLRFDRRMHGDESTIWEVLQNEPNDFTDLDAVNFVGWEANRKNKMGPRMVSLRNVMDPEILAKDAVHLNLKLMKWRLVPDLNLEILQNTKCLLLGAGTLGCAVARNLVGWGFKDINFLDAGKVRYSNPVRQCLYKWEDALAGSNMKAKTAADRLREVACYLNSTGYVIQIPMPGHTVGQAFHAQVVEEAELISEIVQAHDVIFLLTDSRESRWLPTVLGAQHKKIVINAALGFDSYLVMRHGGTRVEECATTTDDKLQIDGLKCIRGNDLGCYFCNDVTAPGNSLKDRTMDQQCTVTRPGISNIAASLAVELLVSLLQHPQRELAPAYYAQMGVSRANIPESMLGIIPHSIRGNICNFETILPATPKFSQCIACSETILKEYRENGMKFLFKAFESAKYLEELTGIADYRDLSNEIIEYSDSDSDMSDKQPTEIL